MLAKKSQNVAVGMGRGAVSLAEAGSNSADDVDSVSSSESQLLRYLGEAALPALPCRQVGVGPTQLPAGVVRHLHRAGDESYLADDRRRPGRLQ